MQEMPSHSIDSGAASPAIILDGADLQRHAEDEAAARADAAHVRRHREMLAMACGIIVLSFILIVRSDEHAAFALLPSVPIPSTCPSQAIFHVDCPGCGLTRSFIFLAHGDWHNAFLRNRMGWLLALAVVLQIPYRLIALRGPNRLPLGRRIPELCGFALVIALIGNWALRMLGM
jgi:hypothetical protein